MKQEAHYIKAEPGYSIVETYQNENDEWHTYLVPIIGWQIRPEDDGLDVINLPITIHGSDNGYSPVAAPDGKVYPSSGGYYDSVEDWLRAEKP